MNSGPRDRSARFDVLAIQSDLIVLVDVGPWDKYLTVTNDAEGVIQKLSSRGLDGRRVIYYDSEGEPTELRHNGARFTGYGPILPQDPIASRLEAIRDGRG